MRRIANQRRHSHPTVHESAYERWLAASNPISQQMIDGGFALGDRSRQTSLGKDLIAFSREHLCEGLIFPIGKF